MDKLEQIKDFLKDRISELEGYLNEDDWDDIERHDIKVCIKEYKYTYDEVEKIING